MSWRVGHLSSVRPSRRIGGSEDGGPDPGGPGGPILERHVLDDEGQAEVGPAVLECGRDVALVNAGPRRARGIDQIPD